MIPGVIVDTAQENKALMLCYFKFRQTAESTVERSRMFVTITCLKSQGESIPNLTHCWLNLKCSVGIEHKVGGAVQTREVWPE